MKDLGSIARTLQWRIAAAHRVAARANQKVFAIRAPGYVPTGKTQDTITFDFYYLFF